MKSNTKRFFASFVYLLVFSSATFVKSCGTDNAFEKLEKKDDKDDAKKDLQNGNYDKAIDSLRTYIEKNPGDSTARTMLVTALMKKIGIDSIGLAVEVSKAGANSWQGIIKAMPEGNSTNVTVLNEAVATLSAIPASQRTADQSYNLALAQASLAVTITKKATGDGMSDTKVDAMSDTDADLIFSTLSNSKTTVSSSSGLSDNAGAQKLGGLVDKISAQQGASNADKTRAFLKSSN